MTYFLAEVFFFRENYGGKKKRERESFALGERRERVLRKCYFDGERKMTDEVIELSGNERRDILAGHDSPETDRRGSVLFARVVNC